MIKNKINVPGISFFHDRILPEHNMRLVGYSALIHRYNLYVPIPTTLCAISAKHRKYIKDNWQVYSPRYIPPDNLSGHLIFALKYEGIDLGVLKALFKILNKEEIEELVKKEPLGAYTRRIWFLYEWLMDEKLNIADLKQGNFISVIDEKIQYPGRSTNKSRYRVRNNLPGVREFCPLIRRTKLLEHYISLNLQNQARTQLASIRADILMRASSFLLLKDSKASYAIEGEMPTFSRAEKWARAIGQAGNTKLSKDELVRLQNIVITDKRFVRMGYRKTGGFIGIHDRETRYPIPEHISAKWEDIDKLISGLIETSELLLNSNYDAVLMAAIIAFGFVFIHPFEDGNGRIHRYLLHHVLVEKGYTSGKVIFPISSTILDKIDQYKKVLEEYSRMRLDLIEWKSSIDGNVEVLNETIDLYRYFDATKQAEFLYECVKITVEEVLPNEISYLQKYDELKVMITNYIDMPENTIDLLINFLRQGSGKLSKRALEKEFNSLTDEEKDFLEKAYIEVFLNTDKQE